MEELEQILKELREKLIDRWETLQDEFDDIDINDIFNDIEKKYLNNGDTNA